MASPSNRQVGQEAAEHGSLADVLNAGLAGRSRQRFFRPDGPGRQSMASIKDQDSHVDVMSVSDGFIVRLFRSGRLLASGVTESRQAVVEASLGWLSQRDLASMAGSWDFLESSEIQLAYERGDATETQWRILLRDTSSTYRQVVDEASSDPRLRRLFPAVGHNFLLFPEGGASAPLASIIFVTFDTYRLYLPGPDPRHVIEGGAAVVVARAAELLEMQKDQGGGA
jgi:hypothetical protein